jgi:hypothetical protein
MIYISLTTVPKRLRYWESLKLNLESLVTQKTDKEYYVILNIPMSYTLKYLEEDNVDYVLSDELLEFAKNNPKLIINRDIYDYGPIVKIIGVLKYATDPDDILIVLDDDEIYHEDMLEYHIRKLDEHPGHVICFSGDMAMEKRTFIENGIKKYMMCSSHLYFPLDRDRYIAMPGHFASVSYKRSFIGEDFNEDLWKLADGDDPLMGYYLKKHEIPILCVKWDKQDDFRPIRDECNPKPWQHFPLIDSLGYPEQAAGYLIRKKNPQTNHGYQSKELMDFFYNHSFVYIEKEQ